MQRLLFRIIKKLEQQAFQLYTAVEIKNKFFWRTLLEPDGQVTARPGAFSPGSLEETQIALMYSYAAWTETPATNREIPEEASIRLGSVDSFVVIERAAPELEQKKGDFGKEDIRIMRFKVTLWPKRYDIVTVPNERMRLWLGHEEPAGKKTKSRRQRLRNLVFQNKDGTYRTIGLSAKATLNEYADEEKESERTTREAKLLDPLLNLRFLKSKWDDYQVYSTIAGLIHAGDRCFDIGYHDTATEYYNRAHDYALHFISKEKDVIIHPADPSVFPFKINLQRARNGIEQDNFEDVLGATDCALSAALMLFQTNEPSVGPSPIDEHGGISKGKFRQWTCECVRNGAAKFGQRIEAEDNGRADYYRSITGHIVGGDDATEQAVEDRAIGIRCYIVSETAPKNAPRPLLELDIRTMERLRITGSDDDSVSDAATLVN
ncbi:MAG: hypothetical protein Q9218_007491 [Villophora microphyllina]